MLRVNTLLLSPDQFVTQMKQEGIQCTAIPFLDYAFVVQDADRRTLTDLESYKKGEFYIQSLASQLVVKALDPQPGETILDMCAAPGSKTTQIAMRMQKKGVLMANDNNRKRLYRLQANAEQQHMDDFIETKNYPGQKYPDHYPEYFDRILIDAPCSSESRFDPRYPKSINFWSRHKVKAMAKKQRRLLDGALKCLKPDGFAVYSTCTLAPEENEQVLTAVLKKHPEVELVDLDWREVPQLSILKEWKEKPINPQVQKAVRLMPDEITEPFFIALLHKKNVK